MKKYFICVVLVVTTLLVTFGCSDADEVGRQAQGNNHNRNWNENEENNGSNKTVALPSDEGDNSNRTQQQTDAFVKKIKEGETLADGTSSSGEGDENEEDLKSLYESTVTDPQVPDAVEGEGNASDSVSNGTMSTSNQDDNEGEEEEDIPNDAALLLVEGTGSKENEKATEPGEDASTGGGGNDAKKRGVTKDGNKLWTMNDNKRKVVANKTGVAKSHKKRPKHGKKSVVVKSDKKNGKPSVKLFGQKDHTKRRDGQHKKRVAQKEKVANETIASEHQ